MAEGNGLLAYLTLGGRFTYRTEEVATESLGYILSRSVAARGTLRKVVSAGGADLGEIKTAWTELVGEQAERVDVACFTSDDPEQATWDSAAKRLLIENKFWAELTDNQPCTYLCSLPSDGEPAVLLFVAPKARVETLWPSLCERAKACVELEPQAGSRYVKCAAVRGTQKRLMLTSWPHLLGALAESGEQALLGDIRQLQALCRKMDDYAPGEPPELEQLVRDATALACKKAVLDISGLAVTKQYHGWGRYVQLAHSAQIGDGIAWFGVNENLNDQHGKKLWLMFGNSTITAEARRRLIPLDPALDDYQQPYWRGPNIPVDPPSHVDGHKARCDAIVKRLEKIAALLSG